MTPIEHYEAALMAAFPEGASGKVFEHWSAARIAQPAPSVPDGWKLVPIEVVGLYNFMCAAFVPMTPQQEQIAVQLELAKRAMLAVAPETKP